VLPIVEQFLEEIVSIILVHHADSCQVIYSMIDAVESLQAGASGEEAPHLVEA
jgi:hypothetical protein